MGARDGGCTVTTHIGANLARAIGATVAELADQLGLTVKQLADAADVRVTQLRRMVDGEDAFNTNHIAKLSIALKVAPSELLGSLPSEATAEPVEADFEEIVYTAHREGWAMPTGVSRTETPRSQPQRLRAGRFCVVLLEMASWPTALESAINVRATSR